MQEERGHKRVELRNRTEKLWMSLMVSEDLNVTTVVHQLSNRETNKESKHDGVRYECYRFDFKATQIRYLRTHKYNNHEGVRYELCNRCNYKATQIRYLRWYQENKH